ncbi:helix-turn-helix domain-containing protein [Zobellella iuensis]|jgi:transcriptional regulator with XRE-family HTH domain|uniref:Helix-turn-helix domain-containing protein n=1 Tax=Zobellella iuensis TaxID=2803811 RepID=A0ABS1QNE8_9GAMM|nr:helix-turn-helix domain-containing protein [Zobellella iuensis]MBL1376365.1 helix-turn-helix domain-containing protein [Zobellella iuensis]
MTNKVNISTDPGADVQTVSQAVATRLKAHRKRQKLSLDELSRRAGVSKGMLVEIEKGSANPSIAILCKVSAALGVSVADIVNVASAPSVHLIENKDIATLWTGPGGGSARLLAGTSGPDMIELWRWEMQPGERFESAGHPPGTVELFHVEQGQLTLRVGETELLVAAGCSAVARTDVPHHYANEGELGLVFSMTVAELHGRTAQP